MYVRRFSLPHERKYEMSYLIEDDLTKEEKAVRELEYADKARRIMGELSASDCAERGCVVSHETV